MWTREGGAAVSIPLNFPRFELVAAGQEVPLPEGRILAAAAGPAHCVAVTEVGSVFSWGWRSCVPDDSQPTGSSAPLGESSAPSEVSVVLRPLFGESGTDGDASGGDVGEGDGNEPESLEGCAAFEQGALRCHHTGEGGAAAGCSERQLAPGDHLGGGFEESPEEQEQGEVPRRSAKDPAVHIGSHHASVMAVGDDRGGEKQRWARMANLRRISLGSRVTSVAAGDCHTLALTEAGVIWGWGHGGEGQLGLGSVCGWVSSPRQVALVGGDSWLSQFGCVTALACGGRHSAALTEGGALLTFGWGLYGQCGHGGTDNELQPRYLVALGGLKVRQVAAGLWHTVAATWDGDVYSWGGNQYGQLGTGRLHGEVRPELLEAPILDTHFITAVSCGARHTAALSEDGKMLCWGWNRYGQLATGDTRDRAVPTASAEGGASRPVKSMACGCWHTLAAIEIAET